MYVYTYIERDRETERERFLPAVGMEWETVSDCERENGRGK